VRHVLVVLLVLWGAVLLTTASMPHLETDGLFFGAVAKSITASGDWLTLRYAPAPDWVVDKPPLTFWITAASLEVGGQSRAALRLWHLLATLALVATTYAIARAALRVEAALSAALILGTMLQVSYQSLTPQQDIPMALFLASACYWWLRHQRDGSIAAAMAAGASVGLATLTKGLAAPAMFGAVVVAQAVLVWRRDRRWPWSARGAVLAAAAAAVIAAPWFVYGAARGGQAFLETMVLGRSGIDRFFHARLRPPAPYWQALVAYVPLLAGGVFPWTGLIPGAIARGREALRDRDAVLTFCLVWFATILIGLAASPGDKVYRYLVPALPPLAILMGAALDDDLSRGRGKRAWLTCGVASAACLAMWLALLWTRSLAPTTAAMYLPIVLPGAAAVTAAAVAAGAAMVAARPRATIVALAAGAVLMLGALQWSLRVRWDVVWPWPAMAARVHGASAPGDHVIVVGSGGPFSGEVGAAAFYFHVPVTAVDDIVDFARIWQRERVFAVMPRHIADGLSLRPRAATLIESPTGWRLVTNRPASPP
jgi:4-amino-4-deoxy-L-arabinose transferase-like glycosyltransferase